MATVDFIYAADCPNVGEARKNLEAAFSAAGLPPRWLEWEAHDAVTPPEFRTLGSPTILVDGQDVGGSASRASGASCRIYAGPQGVSGAPSVERIAGMLRGRKPLVSPPSAAPARWTGLAVVPSLGLAAVPVGLCPVCFAGYVGAFGALGLGFLLEQTVLLPLMAFALVIALAPLAWRARAHGRGGALLLGCAGACVLAVGQFVLASRTAVWLGATGLLAATVWSAWLLPRGRLCPACGPDMQSQPASD